MLEPKLTIRDLTPLIYAPACDSGRHLAHPGETCEEIDELQAVFRSYLDRALAEAYAETDRLLIDGEGTGAPLGFLAMTDMPEPTEAERAFAILEPELHGCPLYRPDPARGVRLT